MTTQGNARSLAKAIGLAIAICGTLDIADAILFYGIRGHVPPMSLLQNIASVPLGLYAFTGHWTTACIGLLIHYCITAFWVIAFMMLAQHFGWMFRKAVLCGLVYGLIVYLCMNFAVLPLYHRGNPFHFNLVTANAILALVLFIGLPVALINARFAPLPVTPR
jgi:hypothetical protein